MKVLKKKGMYRPKCGHAQMGVLDNQCSFMHSVFSYSMVCIIPGHQLSVDNSWVVAC